ncbi:MAG TPA: lamin tail domain-containing protein, partial [Verrucomicrobiales bacterium]|nr:lamin tail domain-containing protein [Verrucomicrobiales bacterium]
MPPRLRFLPLLLAAPLAARAEVVINEIMYHPSSENTAEEYIELYNTGATAADVSGWKFTSGVSMTLPALTSIPAGGYLVVTASPAVFHTKYPGVTNYVTSAGWTGLLSNSANSVVLKNAAGVKMDEVDYSDDGDWGQRERDNPPSFGHRGWGWNSAADGGGKSIELVNAAFDNNEGQNWRPSNTVNGTPGVANSVASANIAPVITGVAHFPPVPASADTVTVTARVRDELTAGLNVSLRFRNDGAATFDTAAMFDDGAHGDGLAGDGIYGAQLPAKPNGTIVEYYISAADPANNVRSWPAMALDYNGTLDHFCNCLYQVDDTVYAGAQPVYYLVMKAADKTELSNINTNTGTPPFAFNPGEATDQTYSHARFNCSFVSRDGTGVKLRYLAGARNRGNGSRSASPQSLNLQFSNAEPWNGVHGLNLNTQHTPFQLFGSALMRKAGLVMAESRAVQVRLNAANAAGAGTPSYGFYACNEVEDSDFADHHYPLDSSGNLYRGFRNDNGFGADLRDQSAGVPAATADPTPYRINYFKETNVSEDRWADLIGLTKALAKGHSTTGYAATYDADFVTAIQSAMDVKQWMNYFAANLIADNNETSIVKGDGDDFYLYFGVTDPRASVISYDLDTLFHRSSGTTTPGDPLSHGIFRMAQSTQSGNPPSPLYPFMAHPQFARVYFQELVRLLDGTFSPVQFNALADEILGPVWDAASIQAVKDFNASRTAFIRTLIPRSISGVAAQTTAGAALTVTSGYPRSTASTCRLTGKTDCVRTVSVKVNGLAATYTPWQITDVPTFATSNGDWVVNNLPLSPGVNRLRIQAFDGANAEIEQSFFDVWFDDGSVASVSGAIAANTTWTAAGGPYQVTANLTVNSGTTLTIQPGTSVYLNSGVTMTVAAGGRIVAEGSESQPIRFTRAPGGTGNGGTITINGQAGAPETHFYYTFFEFGGDPAVVCEGNSNVILDHCEWLRNDVSYLHLDGGSFIVSNCIFPASAPGAYFEGVHGNATPPAGGRAIIRDS